MKNGSKAHERPICRRQRALRDRREHFLELRFLEVLEQYALRAFLRHHPLVVRQIEGGGLHAVIGVAGREDDVYDADRRIAADLRFAKALVDRQVVFQILQLAAEALRAAGISASSVSVMNDSNAALKLNHSSS